jgi:spermidine synthase
MPRLVAIESPFPDDHSVLHLREPPGTCPQTLSERVFGGTYDKPFIVDSWPWRFLHFDFESVQSAMHLEQPDKLCLAYTRKMMAFLLFNRAPKRILLLGLGGGSLAKFCYRRLHATAVTVAEMNPDVIALREEFRIPADDERFRVVRADGAAYVAHLPVCKDVILIDACDRKGTAPELDAIEFYQDAHRGLSPGGVLVTNLCGDWKCCASHLRKIHDVYGDGFLTLKVRSARNLIVFAFKERRADIDWDRLNDMAVNLKRRLGLNFPQYARRLAVDSSLRNWHDAIARSRNRAD